MIDNLAYVGFVSPAADEWRTFGPDILGAEVVADTDDASAHDGGASSDSNAPVRLRIDDRAWRIAIHPGEANDLAYLGWEVTTENLEPMLERVAAFGCTVHEDASLAAQRQVGRACWFTDPFGYRHELVDTVEGGHTFTPGRSMTGGFVTGEQGMGHVVLMAPDPDRGRRFVAEVLGMNRSDVITVGGMEIHFYHCAGQASRHHTLALAPIPGMVGVFHIMLEVEELDDVGTALDRVKRRGLPLPMDLGRHPNDLMTSFYVRSPSGFDVEYGTGGRVVDDDTWEVGAYDRVSVWGHHPPSGGPPPPGIMRPVGHRTP